MSYTPEDIKNIKIRNARVDIGQGVGNALAKAVDIAISRLSQEKKVLATREDYQEEVKFWLDWLYQRSSERIETEHRNWTMDKLPDTNSNPDQWNAQKQQIYDEGSEMDEINAEAQATGQQKKL